MLLTMWTMDSPALLEEAVGDGHAVVWLPGGSGVVRTLAPAKSLGIFRKIGDNLGKKGEKRLKKSRKREKKETFFL